MKKKEIINEKEILLKKTLQEINKNLGNNVLKMGKDIAIKRRLKTSIPEFNKLIGGGIPEGQFSIVWGNKGSGKTTLAYDFIANAQKEGKVCMFLDLECSFDAERAESVGVDTSKLIVGHFTTAEEAMDTLITVCREKVVDFICLDSINAMSPKGEQETKKGKIKSIEDDEMALLARKLSKFFRVSAHAVYEGNVAILLIGQARTQLGGFVTFETLAGGLALGHWSSLIVKLRHGAKADAPYLSSKELVYDKQGNQEFKKNGEPKLKTVHKIAGFNCVIKLEKTKIKSEPELSEISLPFYNSSGFAEPMEIKQERELEEKEIKEQIKTSTKNLLKQRKEDKEIEDEK